MNAIMTTQKAGRKTLLARGVKKLYRRACSECDYRTEWFDTYAELEPHKYCPRGCEESPSIPLNIGFARTA